MTAVRLRGNALCGRASSVLSVAAGFAPVRVRLGRTALGRVGSGFRHVGDLPVAIAYVCVAAPPPPARSPSAPARNGCVAPSRVYPGEVRPVRGACPNGTGLHTPKAGVLPDAPVPDVVTRRGSSTGASSSATEQGAPSCAYGRCSTPSRVQKPDPAGHPSGAANWCSRRPVGRHSPTQLPAPRRSSGPPHSSPASASGRAARRTASRSRPPRAGTPGTAPAGSCRAPPAEPVVAGSVRPDQQQAAVGVRHQQPVVALRRDLQEGVTSPPRSRSRTTAFTGPPPGICRSTASSRPPGPARHRRNIGPGRPPRARGRTRRRPPAIRRWSVHRGAGRGRSRRPVTGEQREVRAVEGAQQEFTRAGSGRIEQ